LENEKLQALKNLLHDIATLLANDTQISLNQKSLTKKIYIEALESNDFKNKTMSPEMINLQEELFNYVCLYNTHFDCYFCDYI